MTARPIPPARWVGYHDRRCCCPFSLTTFIRIANKMTTLPSPGTPQSDLDTPSLCIDLDVMEANISRMASFMTERGKQWRPHEKCHKTPEIAHRQRAAGAIGVTCAKFSEAEVMAAGGITDILVANMIVGAPKVQRVARLCETTKSGIHSCEEKILVLGLLGYYFVQLNSYFIIGISFLLKNRRVKNY